MWPENQIGGQSYFLIVLNGIYINAFKQGSAGTYRLRIALMEGMV